MSNARRRDNSNGTRRKNGGFMATASPMALVSFIIGVTGLATNIGVVGYVYASIEHKLEMNKMEIARNYKEDENTRKDFAGTVSRIDTTIGGMQKLSIEVEIIKVQLTQMNDHLKDIRRVMERVVVPNNVKLQKQ